MSGTVLAAMLAVVIIMAGGCRTSDKSASLSEAINAYEQQHYARSQQLAQRVRAANRGEQRYDAAYIAGLSSYKLGDRTAAENDLQLAALSPKPQTAGNAKAMLGVLRMDNGQYRSAATFFTEASRLLTSEEKQRAAFHAAEAYKQAGDPTSAQTWYTIARAGGSSDSALRQSSVDGMATTGFVLQAGAFREERRARRAAKDAGAVAQRHRLGPVRIVKSTDDAGHRLYLVQFGQFSSIRAADDVRQKIGQRDLIIARAER